MGPVYTKQPSVVIASEHGQRWLTTALQTLARWMGVGLMIQTSRGNLVPLQYNEESGAFEVRVNGEWRAGK